MTVYISKNKKVKTPNRAHNTDAGIDFFIPDDFNNGKPYTMKHGDDITIPSGIFMKQADTDMMKFENKSGIASKSGIIVGACIIDNEYQGELHINLIKITHRPVILKPGQKIAQGIFYTPQYREIKEIPFDELFSEKSERGDGRFGSTGI